MINRFLTIVNQLFFWVWITMAKWRGLVHDSKAELTNVEFYEGPEDEMTSDDAATYNETRRLFGHPHEH